MSAFRLDEEQEDFQFGQAIQVFVPLTQEQLELLELGLTLTLSFFDEGQNRWQSLPTSPVETRIAAVALLPAAAM